MKIHIYALGGLGENGKNMYVIEIDEAIFILDAGIKYPTNELYGIDEIVPDYRILNHKKDNIKGFFMSHAHEDHIGALTHMIKELNAPIYATPFTMEIIKDNFKEKKLNLNNFEFVEISHRSAFKFDEATVSFIKTTHSIPESVAIVLETKEGSIIYTSDFNLNQSNDEYYQTDFKKISELAQKNVLLLMIESLGAVLPTDGSKDDKLTREITNVFQKTNDRIIVSLFSSDLQKIQKVINISLKFEKKIAIIGRKAQRIVDIALKLGYLNIPSERLVNLKYIDEHNKNDDPDLVCLVTGDRHEPFYMLQRMVNKSDRLINITDSDTILVVTSPIPGTEKMAAKTLDTLYRTEANIVVINKDLLTINHATKDEVKMMISLTQPKYIMPVIGDYRMQFEVREIAKEMGYQNEDVFLLDNGDLLKFTNGNPITQKNRFRQGDILIDGSSIGDINDIVIHDRELLSQDGVLIIVGHINPIEKQIKGEIKLITKGFLIEEDVKIIEKEVKVIFQNECLKHFQNKYINWNELKLSIRDEINRYLFQVLRKRPVTVPVLISTEQSETDRNIQT